MKNALLKKNNPVATMHGRHWVARNRGKNLKVFREYGNEAKSQTNCSLWHHFGVEKREINDNVAFSFFCEKLEKDRAVAQACSGGAASTSEWMPDSGFLTLAGLWLLFSLL